MADVCLKYSFLRFHTMFGFLFIELNLRILMNKIMPSKKSELRRILEIGMNIKTLRMELPTTMMTHHFFLV